MIQYIQKKGVMVGGSENPNVPKILETFRFEYIHLDLNIHKIWGEMEPILNPFANR